MNRSLEEDDWHYVKISAIDEKIIKKLIDNLKLDVSEDFFLSFNSLLKLGKRAESEIQSTISEMDEFHKFKKEIFKYLLNYVRYSSSEYPLVAKLYNPDFLIRVQGIKEIDKKDLSYLKFLLPMIRDPDDSVRAAIINLLIKKHLKDPKVLKLLKRQINKESNPVIKEKLRKIFEIN